MNKMLYLLIMSFLILTCCTHKLEEERPVIELEGNGHGLSRDSALSVAKTVMYSNPDSAIKIVNWYLPDSAVLSADEIWRKNDIKSFAFIDISKYDSALKYATANLNYFTNIEQEANTYIMLGSVYSYLPQGNEKSLEYYLKAADICKIIRDSVSLYRTYINLAWLYCDLGVAQKAAPDLFEALKYYEAKENIRGIAYTQLALGRMYSSSGDHEQALEWEYAAIHSFKNQGNNNGIISAYNNVANNLKILGKHQLRLIYLDSAKTLNNNTIKSRYHKGIINQNIAQTLKSLNRFEESDALLDSLLLFMEGLTNSSRYGRLLSSKAIININLKKYDVAEKYLNLALENALENKDLQGEYIVYRTFRTLYKAKKEYKMAHDYLEKARQTDKKLRSKEKDKTMKNMEIVYETEKKNKTIAYQKNEIENQQLTLRNERIKSWFLLSTLLLIIIIFVTVFVFQRKIHKRKAEAEQSRKAKEIARYKLQIVNNQISPHFTFNAINSLKGLIASEKKEAAIEGFSKFSKLINATLSASDSFTNTIGEEMNFIELFLDFRKFRYEDKFEYKINIADNVDINFVILRLSVQELVENAIKHGIRHKKNSNGLVEVDVRKDEKHYTFTVTDNGIGRENARKIVTEGTGKGGYIQNMMNTILNISNKWPSIITYTDIVDIDGKAAGTRAILKIPVGYKYEV